MYDYCCNTAFKEKNVLDIKRILGCSICEITEFLGFLTSNVLDCFYNNSDVFMLVPLLEGIVLVVLEAFALVWLLIYSDNAGVNDLIENYKNDIV
jgi:glycosyltransferase involved in cell wall biosynthesis